MGRTIALSEVQRDDAELRITLWQFPPGSETGWHVHELAYVVVPVNGGDLTVEDKSGSRAYPIAPGRSYSRPAGIAHNIANDSAADIAFVEIEFKAGGDPPPAAA